MFKHNSESGLGVFQALPRGTVAGTFPGFNGAGLFGPPWSGILL